jgi:hypothetical protein
MLAFAPLLLAAATSAHPPLSTWDQAACDADEEVQLTVAIPVPAEPEDCSDESAGLPAVLDCNDPGLELYLAGMIGSCDMPRAPSPDEPGPPALRSGRGAAPPTSCDLLGCRTDEATLGGGGTGDDRTPALAARIVLDDHLCSTPLHARADELIDHPLRRRLERPPRV